MIAGTVAVVIAVPVTVAVGTAALGAVLLSGVYGAEYHHNVTRGSGEGILQVIGEPLAFSHHLHADPGACGINAVAQPAVRITFIRRALHGGVDQIEREIQRQ